VRFETFGHHLAGQEHVYVFVGVTACGWHWMKN
jgi:hypothetical protein